MTADWWTLGLALMQDLCVCEQLSVGFSAFHSENRCWNLRLSFFLTSLPAQFLLSIFWVAPLTRVCVRQGVRPALAVITCCERTIWTSASRVGGALRCGIVFKCSSWASQRRRVSLIHVLTVAQQNVGKM